MAGLFDRMANWLAGTTAPEGQPVPPPAPVPVPDAGAAPAAPALSADPRLPDASTGRIARLASLMADIEARTQDHPLLVSALTEVRHMRDTHLPQLIASYADIPPAHRAEIFRQTGRSASYNLNEALDRMIARLEAVSRSIAQDNIDSFADNLRFIEHRYGADGSEG